jgi:hypothetical protein
MSPGIALQGIELDELSGRVALCRPVSATDGSQNGSLRPTVSEDAVRYHSIYGVYGISVFAVRGATIDELAQQAPRVASIA